MGFLGPGFFSYCLIKTMYWEWSKLKYNNAVTLMDKYLVRDGGENGEFTVLKKSVLSIGCERYCCYWYLVPA